MSIAPDRRALSSKIKAAQIEFHDDHALKTVWHQSCDVITKKNWEQL
jgi:nucleoside-specific outer membrane channel protein Tsx